MSRMTSIRTFTKPPSRITKTRFSGIISRETADLWASKAWFSYPIACKCHHYRQPILEVAHDSYFLHRPDEYWQSPEASKQDTRLLVKRVLITSDFGEHKLPKWISWIKARRSLGMLVMIYILMLCPNRLLSTRTTSLWLFRAKPYSRSDSSSRSRKLWYLNSFK